MSVLDREEINAFTKEIVEATTDAARDSILEKLTGGGAVKSVQKGLFSFAGDGNKQVETATATINAVDLNKAVIVPCGVRMTTDHNSSYSRDCTLELTSATQIKGTRNEKSSYYHLKVAWQVVEFY